MTRYMLISVSEREFSEPLFFTTKEAAHDAMCEEVAEVLDVPVESIKESYLNGVEFDDNTCVLDDTAWTGRFHMTTDWKIIPIGIII